MKICSKCGESKPLDAFYICGGRMLPRCKKCHSKLMKARQKRLIEQNKKVITCADCGLVFKTSFKITKRCRSCQDERTRLKVNGRSIKYNREKPEYRKKINQITIQRMPDSYIRRILVVLGWEKESITPDVISAWRSVLKLKRAVKGIEA